MRGPARAGRWEGPMGRADRTVIPPEARTFLHCARGLSALLLAFPILAPTAGAGELINEVSYTFVTSANATLEDMNGSLPLPLLSADDAASEVPIALDFKVRLAGVEYDRFSVNSNGLLRLGTVVVNTAGGNDLANTDNVPQIAPYWDDIAIGAMGKVHYVVMGTSPNRKLVVEWSGMLIPKTASDGGSARFQCWLYEGSGKIEFVYGGGVVANAATGGYSVGFGIAANDFVSVSTAAGIVSYGVSTNGNTAPIRSGTKYTFQTHIVSRGGDWNNSENWIPPSIPTANDDVTIVEGATANVDAAAFCRTLTVGRGVQAVLSIRRGGALNVTGEFSQLGGAVSLGDGTLEVGGRFSLTGGEFSPGTGSTVKFSGNTTQSIGTAPIFYRFHHLLFTGSTKTLASGALFVVEGDLQVEASARLALSAPVATRLQVGGDVVYAGLPGGTGISNLSFELVGGSPVPESLITRSIVEMNVVIAGAYRLGSDIEIGTGRTLKLQNGRLECFESLVEGGGSLNVSAASTLATAHTNGLAGTLGSFAGTRSFNDAIVEYDRDGSQRIVGHPQGAMLHTAGTGTKRLGEALIIGANSGPSGGALKIGAGSTFDDGGSVLTLTSTGNVLVQGVYSTSGGRLVFTGGSEGSYIEVSHDVDFGDLALNFGSSDSEIGLRTTAGAVEISFRDILFGGPGSGTAGGTLRLNEIGTTNVTVRGKFEVKPSNIATTGGGFAGDDARVIVMGDISSTSIHPAQSILRGVRSILTIGEPMSVLGQGLTLATHARLAEGVTLRIENPKGLELQSARTYTIDGTLDLNGGSFDADAGRGLLAIGTGGKIVRNEGYVVGRLQRVVGVAQRVRFDVGTADVYAPVHIDFAGVTKSGTITAEVTPGAHPSIATSGLDPTQVVERYWKLGNAGVVGDVVGVTLGLTQGDCSDDLRVRRYTSGAWQDPAPTSVISCPGQEIHATGLDPFGDLVVGVPCPGITLDPMVLATALQGLPYGPKRLAASGSAGPYLFSLEGAPPWLTLTPTPDGRAADLESTDPLFGSYTLTAVVTDAHGCTLRQQYTLEVDLQPVSVDQDGGLGLKSGDRRIILSWENSADERFAGVVIRYATDSLNTGRNDGSFLRRIEGDLGTVQSFAHEGLTNGTEYFYNIFTFDRDAHQSKTPVQLSGAPEDVASPDSLAAFTVASEDGFVTLRWTNPADADVIGTRILFSGPLPADPPPVPSAPVCAPNCPPPPRAACPLPEGVFPGGPGESGTFTHRGLVNGSEYRYRAIVYDDDCNPSESTRIRSVTPADVTPPTPVRRFTATPGDNEILLAWIRSLDPDLKGVEIRFSATEFPEDEHSGVSLGLFETENRVTHTGLTNKSTYYYSIFSVDRAGLYSVPVRLTGIPVDVIPPPAMARFKATGQDNDQGVELEWDSPQTVPADYKGVLIRFSTLVFPATPTSGEPLGVFGPDTLSHHHMPLQNGQRYYYSAFAVDDETPPNHSPVKQDVAMPVDLTPPDPITDFLAMPNPGRINLSWTYLNPSADFKGFLIRFAKGNRSPKRTEGSLLARIEDPYVSSFEHRSLEDGEEYSYTAWAFDDEAVSNFSDSVTVSIIAGDWIPPAVPSIAAVGGGESVTLTWTNPPDEDFVRTIVDYSKDQFFSQVQLLGEFEGAPGSTHTIVHENLEGRISYYYRAVAVDMRGNRSGAVTTDAAHVEDITPPLQPTNFKVATTRDGKDLVREVALEWTNPTDPFGDFEGVLIRYSTLAPPSTPESGTVLKDVKGTPGSPGSDTHMSVVPGVRYYYAIFAYDTPRADGSAVFAQPVHAVAIPKTDQPVAISDLPDPFPPELAPTPEVVELPAYHLVSFPYDIVVPGVAKPKLSDVFPKKLGVFGKDWRAVSWTGIDTTGTAVETVDPFVQAGMGYWIVSRNPIKDHQGALRLDEARSVEGRIPLAPTLHLGAGWNIVGAPLADRANDDIDSRNLRIVHAGRTLTLPQARDNRIVGSYFYDYKHRTRPEQGKGADIYQETPVSRALRIDKWTGQLLFAYQDCELCYYCGLLPDEGQKMAPEIQAEEPLLWTLSLSARSRDLTDPGLRVGASEAALQGWDPQDLPKLPSLGGGLQLAIMHPGWDPFPLPYMQSIGAAGQAEYRWSIRAIRSGEGIEIVWEDVESLPGGWNAYLILPAGAAVPLAPGATFSSPTVGGRFTAELLVTPQAWTGPILRSGYSGLGRVPSPVRGGAMTISYHVLHESQAALRIYDVRGRVIWDFGAVPSRLGTWEVGWDGRVEGGRPAPAGVYFVRLSLGERQDTAKVVLLR